MCKGPNSTKQVNKQQWMAVFCRNGAEIFVRTSTRDDVSIKTHADITDLIEQAGLDGSIVPDYHTRGSPVSEALSVHQTVVDSSKKVLYRNVLELQKLRHELRLMTEPATFCRKKCQTTDLSRLGFSTTFRCIPAFALLGVVEDDLV